MGEAAKISLKAIGMQDTHLLSKDPEDSLFNPSYKQHSEFRKYHRTRTVDNLGGNEWWPFGHTVKVEFNPQTMGDLLTNIWVKIALPEWTASEKSDWSYVDFVGRRLIKNIKMNVNETTLQEIDTEMLVIFDQLYKSYDQKLSLNAQFNLNRYSNKFSYVPELDLDAQNNLFINIPLFFSQNYGGDAYEENRQKKPPFPTCAIHRQKIQFEIEFHKPTYFIYSTLTSRVLPSKLIDNFKIVTEEITLNDEERLYYKSNLITIPIEIIKKHSSRDIHLKNDRTFSINLEPTIPVKMFHWFFRSKYYEDEGDYHEIKVQNRMNFKGARFRFSDPLTILGRASFTLNGEVFPRVTKLDAGYFKRYIPYTSKMSESGLIPSKLANFSHYDLTEAKVHSSLAYGDIFSYNFALYPKSTQPSGFLDFSQLNSDKTQLHIELSNLSKDTEIRYVEDWHKYLFGIPLSGSSYLAEPFSLEDFTMYLYYTGYNMLNFENGFISFVS
jgi:hypothetical protein